MANQQFHTGEIDVLDPQAQRIENPQSRSIQEQCHQARHAIKAAKHGTHLLAREDNRQPLGTFGADHSFNQARIDFQHTAIEKEQGAKGLVLGGGRNVSVNGQMGQKGIDLGRPHLQRVALVVEENVPLDPIDVGCFGPDAVVAEAAGFADPVEQPGLARLGSREGRRDELGIHSASSTACRSLCARRWSVKKKTAARTDFVAALLIRSTGAGLFIPVARSVYYCPFPKSPGSQQALQTAVKRGEPFFS